MANWTDGDVISDGMPIHYYRTGDGSKPALVLLHGFTDYGLCWTRVAKDLEADYDVTMIDAIGHGHSGGTERGFRGRATTDVLAVIAGLNLARPALMGHSMGAGTAAEVASKAPEMIRALILEDPGWRDVTPPANEAVADNGKGSRAALGSPSWRAWATAFKAMSPAERYAEALRERPEWPEEELGPWSEAKALLNFGVFDEPRSASNWREIAPQIVAPTLLLTANPERGGIVTPETAKEALALLPHGRAVNFPEAGHNIRREAYDGFIAAVRGFLKETL
ncbi:MAG TPA: alpha/beta hydrolase [Thermomicrobiales bacterium]|jgi:pimeloyl-ACP methyl ester carboxylesterase